VVARARARLERWASIDSLLASEAVGRTLVGRSPAWRRVLRQVVEVARFTDAPVRSPARHSSPPASATAARSASRASSTRSIRARSSATSCCSAARQSHELSGSEFFRHEKGSFTGAVAARNGAFALADEGTLFQFSLRAIDIVHRSTPCEFV
jgi:transcriptional regulator with GAF, ATPase, and Fis domain